MATVASPKYHWKLNDNADNTNVLESINSANYTGSQNTSTFHIEGKIDGAFTFDGNDFVSITNLTAVAAASVYSVAAWFNTNTVASGNYEIFQLESGGTAGIFLRIQTNKIGSYLEGDESGNLNAVGSTTLDTNTWYHAVTTFDGTNLKVYLNGNEDGSDTGTRRGTYESTGRIGSHLAGVEFFNGEIDDVRFYDFVLDTDEIAAIYNSGNGTEEQNPTIGGNPKGCLLGFLGKGIIPSVRNC